MELSIGQALQQGIAAHREGKLQDAEHLYRAILRAQPNHPDANHNLGVLAVAVGKPLEALPLFKLALDANPHVEQFWLSYVDTLVKVNQLEDAKQVLAGGIRAGISEDKLEVFYQQLSKTSPMKRNKREGMLLSEKRKKFADKNNRKKRKAQKQPPSIAPSEHQLNHLLEHYQAGHFEHAERLAISMTREFPDHEFGWKVLGAIFTRANRLNEALAATQRSVELAPQDAEAFCSLGAVLQKLQRIREAEDCYRLAVKLAPNYPDALNNLGTVLHALCRFEEAEEHYRQAIALRSGYAEAYSNLGLSLKEMGRWGEALQALAEAVYLRPDFDKAKVNLGVVLRAVDFHAPQQWLYPALSNLLTTGNFFRVADISSSVLRLLKLDPLIRDFLSAQATPVDLDEAMFTIDALEQLSVLHHLIRICPLPDLEFERMFVSLRRILLKELDRVESSPTLINFLSSLSLHCFTNEYVYFETDEEIQLVDELEHEVSMALSRELQPVALHVLCLASYRPLHLYEWHKRLDTFGWDKDVTTRLIDEPRAEKEIMRGITLLSPIADPVSCKVREQYEESPYPRWVRLSIPLETMTIDRFCDKLELRLQSNNIRHVYAPQILVAGCGTGQHSIETASRFSNCHVTAVDLSLSSLAYALRKTNELGVKNLKYVQADILDLHELEVEFDVIESSGVLHHMDNPLAGWQVLTDVLKPGGLMKIALYSESARRNIVKKREELTELGVGSSVSEIRAFRQALIESNSEDLPHLAGFRDFFSLSEIRDLMFHVQEHRFSLQHIRHCLDELGLRFCGFDDKEVVTNFRASSGEFADIYDLEEWIRFEESKPDTFRSMYQFWCQKI